MKNKNNKSKLLLILLSACLNANVVITEIFINSEDGTKIPQYIELYNASSIELDLTNWSIETWLISTECNIGESTTDCEEYKKTSLDTKFDNSNNSAIINNLIIVPYGYFVISSNYVGGTSFSNKDADIQVKYELNNIGAQDEIFGDIKGNRIYLLDNNNEVQDEVIIDVDQGWPSTLNLDKGRSWRLHANPDPSVTDNNSSQNWSISPLTERSIWLTGGTKINYGSPGKENSFKLNSPFQDSTLIIYNDYNNYYSENNYNDLIDFSWVGTSHQYPDYSYNLIINKLNSTKYIYLGSDAIIDNNKVNVIDTVISGTSIQLSPQSLFVDTLEISNYDWTIELVINDENVEDNIIYSDLNTFTLDAIDYGKYGCVDNGCCTDDINLIEEDGCPKFCPTDKDDNLFISNYPIGCSPGINCMSAINYYDEATIHSNTCHYISVSLPAFTLGDKNSTVSVPLYLNNDSSIVESVILNSIEYLLDISDTSNLNFINITFPDSIETYISSHSYNSNGAQISIKIPFNSNLSFNKDGILNYLNFDLSDIISSTELKFNSIIVEGGIPDINNDPNIVSSVNNSISVPVIGGKIIIKEGKNKVSGIVSYYDSEFNTQPYEVPDVKISLKKKFDENLDNLKTSNTNEFGAYSIENIEAGNYILSLKKDEPWDSICALEDNYYVGAEDVTRIAQHVSGVQIFDENQQYIAADVSLDGNITGLDASLVAQYIVGYIDDLNTIKTHWIFKPIEDSTLAFINAELIKKDDQYHIEYKPLTFDDNRDIFAYRLGDVTGNYCSGTSLSRINNVETKEISVEYQSEISLDIGVDETIMINSIYLEIEYNDLMFDPISFDFDPLDKFSDGFNSISNLYSNNGSIKVVVWTSSEPKLFEGVIGNLRFKWNKINHSGKISINEFLINNSNYNGGIFINGNSNYGEVEIVDKLMPSIIHLNQNYPNPFNPVTNINWEMRAAGHVYINVFNIKGQLVEVLINEKLDLGNHNVVWNATDYPSGIYFYNLNFNDTKLQKKMILLR